METVSQWQILLVLLGLLAGWSGIIIGALRVMFKNSFAAIDDKLKAFNRTTASCADLEREFLEFKAEMPVKYVMREDFIRFEVGVNYKLDKLRDLILEDRHHEKGNPCK